MKKQIMRAAAMGMSLAMVAGVMSGCGDSKKSSADADGKIVITVGDYFADETANPEAYAKDMKQVAEFEKLHPDIKIEDANWGFDVQSYMAKAEAGALPTIYYAPLTETKKIIEMGYAADLTDEFKERGFYDEVNSYMLELISDDRGKIYFLPSGNYDVGIAVNVKLYGDAGFVNDDGTLYQPTDWDDLARVAKTIKEKTGADGFMIPTTGNCGGWRVTPIAWSNGVTFETKEGGKWKATFDSPEFVKTIQYISDLKWKYDVLPAKTLVELEEPYKQLAAGSVAMCFAEADSAKNAVNTYGMDVKNIGFLRMPAGDKRRVTLMGGGVSVIDRNASKEQIKAAMDWEEFLGVTTKLDDAKRESLRKDYETQKVDNELVGILSVSPWKSDSEVENYKHELSKKFMTVNEKYFTDFNNKDDMEFQAEEPIDGQALYAVIDNIVQEVLNNKNANIEELVKKGAADFQKNNLDYAE